ncbi:kexin KEX2 Ecym_6486 [Eremothecium cymbalariae DBVPG|uniref:P/Homo B domain-containing protein n=1 Tax=Eremothecium cymbalariae (strain CBS 270.75 / DBVPG 7215 / KCTC 17166 / NRRL Y-17582) TaxID=931890 RepID=G8JUS4_ERECY|nr:hypothetical protein Ecym_6486 [Eremothecium cymbalariae DBVPG\
MKIASFFGSLAILQWVNGQVVPVKDHVTRKYFAVESYTNVEGLLRLHNDWRFEHEVRGLNNHYVFSKELDELQKRSHVLDTEDRSILSFHELPPKKLHKRLPIFHVNNAVDSSQLIREEVKERLKIEDPIFDDQWHLVNTNFPGNDLNITELWYNNITGHGVVAAIVDDGLDYESEDLKDNFCAEGSWDFNANTALPKPILGDDNHGTRCAGEIAAAKNKVCGVGVAYNAKVSGIRILSADITSEDEAASLVYGLNVNDIYSCSWGPEDNGKEMMEPDDLVKKAFVKGIVEGRNGKGALYVFASGNGGGHGDNCNYDGYTNSIFSITVSAIDHKGFHPPYAEVCSAVLVVTYSSGSGDYIHSTDIHGSCSHRHSGTSAAAPLAAGVYALVLQVNDKLTWRDVQYLTILYSTEINSHDDWQDGALGKRYSHVYGYGKLDAYNIVEAAKTWENVNPQTWFYSKTKVVDKSTTAQKDTLESTIIVTHDDLDKANFKRVEHVTVTVDIDTTIRGLTTVDLISPDGRISHLGVERNLDLSSEGFQKWTFMSVAHWGESGIGEWKLEVKATSNKNTVNFCTWRLKLFGESIDASKTTAFQFGNDIEDEEEDNADQSSQLTEPVPTSYSQVPASTTPNVMTTTEASQNGYIPGVNKISTHEVRHYYLTIFGTGAVFLLLYFIFFSKSRRIRRSRAEAFEFDIIDTDSDYDSTMDQGYDPTARILNDEDIEEFDFDLSDEENVRSNSASPLKGGAHNSKNTYQNLSTIIEDVSESSAAADNLPAGSKPT